MSKIFGYTLTGIFALIIAAVPIGGLYTLGRSIYYTATYEKRTGVVEICASKVFRDKHRTKYAPVIIMEDGARVTSITYESREGCFGRNYLSDISRHENSAEHSWHLAITLLALKDMMPPELNIDHALRIALAHDVCEIGPGDVSIHSPLRAQKAIEEEAYMAEFAAKHQGFALQIQTLWQEYEEKNTRESRWVEVVDRLLPFLLNITTEGLVWREEGIGKNRVLKINTPIAKTAPDLYEWIVKEVEKAVEKGWLKDE